MLQVAGYTGLLVAAPAVLNQVLGYILPGLTTDERKVVSPTIFASSALFFVGYVTVCCRAQAFSSSSEFDFEGTRWVIYAILVLSKGLSEEVVQTCKLVSTKTMLSISIRMLLTSGFHPIPVEEGV